MLHNFDANDFADKAIQKIATNTSDNLSFAFKLQSIEHVLAVANSDRKPDREEILSPNNAGPDYRRYDGPRNVKSRAEELITDRDRMYPEEFVKTFPARIKAGLQAADSITLPHNMTGKAAQMQLEDARQTAKSFLRSMAREISKVQPELKASLEASGITDTTQKR